MQYYIYMLTNKTNKVIYTGVTNNISRRLDEHINKASPNSFTAKYNCHKLIYLETCDDAYTAISREKQIKSGSRKKKIDLIESLNPDWDDLSKQLV